MQVFTIPDSLSHHYKGAGIALAATDHEQVLALIYLRDIIPDFPDTVSAIPDTLDNARVAKVAQALERDFGFVRVGMASAWEFTEL